MHKQKTHKGLKKRVTVTARGKIKRKRSFAGHLMSGKSGNRCRSLRKTEGMSNTMARKTRTALGA
ncbi:MAG: 50S ribosomal protein L35 [Sedimentisphaerales bacterium]|nr:50S ribosomal protein L35 [Sedimentisphaerales bacterium]